MPSTDVSINFRAELRELRKSLEQLPDITDKQARGMVKKLNRSFRAAERAAKKNSKKVTSTSEKMSGTLQAAKEAAEGFGGEIGGMAGMVEKFAKSGLELSGALGPIPLALGGVALATVGWTAVVFQASTALVEFVANADKLVESTKEFDDVFGPIPQDRIESLHRTADAMEGVEKVSERLTVLLASQMAPDLEESAVFALKLGFALEDLVERASLGEAALKGLVNLLTGNMGALVEVTGLGATAQEKLTDATEDYDQKARDLIGSIREKKEEEREAAEKARALAAAQRAAAEEERERAAALRELERELKAQQDAQASLRDIIDAAGADQLDQFQLRQRAYEDELEQIKELGQAAGDRALVEEATNAARERFIRDTSQLALDELERRELAEVEVEQSLREMREESLRAWLAQADAALAHVDQIAGSIGSSIETFASLRIDALQEEAEAEVAAAEEANEAWREQAESRLERLHELGRITDAEYDSRLAQIDAEAEARQAQAERLAKDEQKAAKKGFKVVKAAQITQAIIDSARNAVALTPAFIPLAGPAAPAAAATAAGLGLAAQLAVIRAQKPPEFALGGMVGDRAYSGDHVPILASPYEGILSPRGVAAAGGPDGVDALNHGTPGKLHVDFRLDRRLIASSVSSTLTSDPMVQAQLDARAGAVTGQTLIYGRG